MVRAMAAVTALLVGGAAQAETTKCTMELGQWVCRTEPTVTPPSPAASRPPADYGAFARGVQDQTSFNAAEARMDAIAARLRAREAEGRAVSPQPSATGCEGVAKQMLGSGYTPEQVGAMMRACLGPQR